MTARWARWNASAGPWSVALEEDVLLLRPPGWAPAELAADEIVAALPCVKAGAHPSVVTQSTSFHARIAEASGEVGERSVEPIGGGVAKS